MDMIKILTSFCFTMAAVATVAGNYPGSCCGNAYCGSGGCYPLASTMSDPLDPHYKIIDPQTVVTCHPAVIVADQNKVCTGLDLNGVPQQVQCDTIAIYANLTWCNSLVALPSSVIPYTKNSCQEGVDIHGMTTENCLFFWAPYVFGTYPSAE